uniref:Corticotropin-releasing factor domain-containing protein n=1 Tax=Aquila chrysaetos chrysaetos TaxID=223781 RepID=A0A663FJW2_AQUCH
MPFTALLPAGRLIRGRCSHNSRICHPDPHPAAQHPASPGALPGTRVGYGAEEDAEARHNSVHVGGLARKVSLSLDVPTHVLKILLDLAREKELQAKAAANAELMARLGRRK